MSLHRRTLSRIARFLKNESGNYAIIFGITIFPILGAAGLAVDYANMHRHRGAVQNALDAAALAAAKQFGTGVSGNQLEAYATDFFQANLPDYIDPQKVKLTFERVNEQARDSNGEMSTLGTIKLDATLEYDSFLANVFGHDRFDLPISAQVAMGNITVEVALVMDNSGSMNSNGRINLAKSTAKDLVDTIYAAAANSNKPDPVSFSLVPFAGMVNIGEDYADARWMDTRGLSPIHHENLNWWSDPANGTQGRRWVGPVYEEKRGNKWFARSRFDLYDRMNIDWLGCVEMRPWPHSTLDTVAATATPGQDEELATENSLADIRARLFVPAFAPDEPDRYYRTQSGRYRRDYYYYGNDYAEDWKRLEERGSAWIHNRTDHTVYNTPASSDYSFTYDRGSNAIIRNNQNKRQDTVYRYHPGALKSSPPRLSGAWWGPNYNCSARPVMPLTTSDTRIKNSIGDMRADGSTNIQAGVAWGWRTLTPKEPFTGGRDATDATNRKYMIVLTDGNNFYGDSYTPNETSYGAWGYGKHDRIEEGLTASDLAGTPYAGRNLYSFERKMNAHTVQTCGNARNDGVTIFAIAFDVSDGSSVKEMLNACAGTGVVNGRNVLAGGQFYFDVKGDELRAAMAAIASQISELRIVR